MRELGNLSGLGNCGAISRMEIGQTRGASIKVGDKKMFEIQNGMGIRGRKWKQINPHVQDPLKERSGPQLKGAASQGSG